MAEYITTREYADLHGIPLETVRAWCKRGNIPFVKVGKSVMIDRSTPKPTRKAGRPKKDEVRQVVASATTDEVVSSVSREKDNYNKGYQDGFKSGYAKAVEDCLEKLRELRL